MNSLPASSEWSAYARFVDLGTLEFPMVDGHTHLFYDRPFLAQLFSDRNMRVVIINITGRRFFQQPMERRWNAMVAMKHSYPDRVALCTTFNPRSVVDEAFARNAIAQLREHIAQGASMVKVWKDIGMEVLDSDRSFIQIDDARFRPIWDWLAREGIPVLAHIAEPKACWLPLDRKSPHYAYYRDNPQYHAFQRPEIPSWEVLIEARDRWIEANPGLTIVGAHFGSNEHDISEVAERLDCFPNYSVDTAERFDDLFIQPREMVRDFFRRYHNRIIYGTDFICDQPASAMSTAELDQQRSRYTSLLNTHWQYLSTAEEIEVGDKMVEPVHVRSLDLPLPVLKDLYHDNIVRLAGLNA